MINSKEKLKKTELKRLLSKLGIASRTKSIELILSGKVKVNGKVLKDPLAYVSIESKITIEEIDVKKEKNDLILIALNKPKGFVTTSSDEKGRKTVYDILPEKYQHLKAVGRLDMATSGLLLFTNDNYLADQLLNPKNKIPRTYIATVDGKVEIENINKLKAGIKEEGEILKAKEIEIRKVSNKESILIITLTEGKNREIRRMCKSIGNEIIKLKRISFGNIELGNLNSGEIKVIDLKKFY